MNHANSVLKFYVLIFQVSQHLDRVKSLHSKLYEILDWRGKGQENDAVEFFELFIGTLLDSIEKVICQTLIAFTTF